MSASYVSIFRYLASTFLLLSTFMLAGCPDSSNNDSGAATGSSGPTLRSITVTPQTAEFANGTSVQLSAEGNYSDGTQKVLTGSVTWSSSDDTIATVTNATEGSTEPAGRVNGISPGVVTISATLNGVTGSTGLDAIEVKPVELTDLEVSPESASVPAGLTERLTATGLFSDGSSQDLSDQVTWTSDDDAVASVDSSGVVTAVTESATAVLITAELDGFQDSSEITVVEAVISAIQVEPANALVAAGRTQMFTATASFSNGDDRDVTSDVSWLSSDTSIATIDETGSAGTLVAGGPITITASLGDVSGTANLTVNDAVLTALQIEPGVKSIPKGRSQQFTATGTYSDSKTADVTNDVEWTSADSAIATIDGTGLAQGRDVGGPIVVTATLGDVTDTAELTVGSAVLESLEVSSPSNRDSIAKGTSTNFAATGIYSDGSSITVTSDATWLSTITAVANVSNASGNKGFIVGKAEGSTQIRAELEGVSGEKALAVTAADLTAIQVAPSGEKLSNGFSRQFSATGFYTDGGNQDITEQVTWASSDTAVAGVSNVDGSEGLVTADGVETGTIVISAAMAGKSGNASLNVVAATLQSIAVTPGDNVVPMDPDTRIALTATGTFSDGSSSFEQDLTEQVTWSSESAAVATVSNAADTQGVVTPVSVGGPVGIRATFDAVQGVAQFEVTDAALESITVTPAAVAIAIGEGENFIAMGNYSDNQSREITESVTWASDNPDVTVSNAAGTEGQVSVSQSAVSGDTAAITASMSSGGNTIVSSPATVDITDAVLESIAVKTQPTAGVSETPAGTSVQFAAEGTYSDGTVRDISATVSWTLANETPATSNENVADIGNSESDRGELSTFNPGTVDVLATDVASGVAGGAYAFEVTDAIITGLVITPDSPAIALNAQQEFIATAQYSDGSSRTVTDLASWSSDNTAVATVNNTDDKGLATSQGMAGAAEISASFDGMDGATTLTVNPATLVSISVAPGSASIPKGYDVQYTATGHYSDGSQSDITTQVNWATFSGFAVIGNGSDNKGLATGISDGEDTVTASLEDLVGSATLTVTDETLDSIVVSSEGDADEMAFNETLQYSATGNFSGGSTLDITQKVTWTSSNPGVATISNAEPSKGLATAEGLGDTIISATIGEVSGEKALTVTLF
jgi:uncharacterized protein YjdB